MSSIRNFQELSKYLGTRDPAVVSFLNFYAPALIVEGLVRAIPNIIKVGVIVVRFKARSERDHYVLGWYFYFRLITFVFIIISDTIVDSSTSFVEDPIDFFQELSKNVALNSQFFISYGESSLVVRSILVHCANIIYSQLQSCNSYRLWRRTGFLSSLTVA